jgi:hypothetical protein
MLEVGVKMKEVVTIALLIAGNLCAFEGNAPQDGPTCESKFGESEWPIGLPPVPIYLENPFPYDFSAPEFMPPCPYYPVQPNFEHAHPYYKSQPNFRARRSCNRN